MLLLVILWQQLLAALSNKQQAQPEPVRVRTPSTGSPDQQAFVASSAAELFRCWNTTHCITTLSGISATARISAAALRANFDAWEAAPVAALPHGRALALADLFAPEDTSSAASADLLSPESRT